MVERVGYVLRREKLVRCVSFGEGRDSGGGAVAAREHGKGRTRKHGFTGDCDSRVGAFGSHSKQLFFSASLVLLYILLCVFVIIAVGWENCLFATEFSLSAKPHPQRKYTSNDVDSLPQRLMLLNNKAMR